MGGENYFLPKHFLAKKVQGKVTSITTLGRKRRTMRVIESSGHSSTTERFVGREG